jgi:hypothetical protein
MSLRRITQLAVISVILFTGLGYAAPVAASVRYLPQTKSGFIGADTVQRAFGWDAAKLAARASEVSFSHQFLTTDAYVIWCGEQSFPLNHQREFGSFRLRDVVVKKPYHGSRAADGRGSGLVGFQISGPSSALSGTTVPPRVGEPCLEVRGTSISRIDLVSTIAGWSLTVSSGGLVRTLRTGR